MRLLSALFVLIVFSGNLFAQQNINLDELRTPSSPGFSMLGVQPTEISRPTSWRAFQTTLANSFFQDNKVVIPKDFAMEFNPFFASHGAGNPYSPTYAFTEAGQSNMPKTLRDNFSISVATGNFKSYLDTSKTNPRMGLGVRTQFVQMKATPEAQAIYFSFRNKLNASSEYQSILDVGTMSNSATVKDLENVMKNAKDGLLITHAKLQEEKAEINIYDSLMNIVFADYIEPVFKKALASNKTVMQTLDTLTDVINNLPADLKIKNSIEEVKNAIGDKYGFALEGATAILVDYPTNDIAFSKVPKFGLWFTGTYRSMNQHWEFGLIGRYMNSSFEKDSKLNILDAGGRAMLEGDNWSVNYEFIQRFQWNILSTSSTVNGQKIASVLYSEDFKMSLTANYKINDNIIINYTFGNNFTVNTEFKGDTGNIISTVGLVYALGGPKVRDILGK